MSNPKLTPYEARQRTNARRDMQIRLCEQASDAKTYSWFESLPWTVIVNTDDLGNIGDPLVYIESELVPDIDDNYESIDRIVWIVMPYRECEVLEIRTTLRAQATDGTNIVYELRLVEAKQVQQPGGSIGQCLLAACYSIDVWEVIP